MLASLLIPVTPNSTVTVYMVQIRSKTQIVIMVVTSNPNTTPIPFVNRGVANENVVAVAHTTAKMAIISITCPRKPSTLSPKSGRHASEKR